MGRMQQSHSSQPTERGRGRRCRDRAFNAAAHPPPPGPSFSDGHTGQVIIICQALVHTCNATEGGEKEDNVDNDREYVENKEERGGGFKSGNNQRRNQPCG